MEGRDGVTFRLGAGILLLPRLVQEVRPDHRGRTDDRDHHYHQRRHWSMHPHPSSRGYIWCKGNNLTREKNNVKSNKLKNIKPKHRFGRNTVVFGFCNINFDFLKSVFGCLGGRVFNKIIYLKPYFALYELAQTCLFAIK